MPTIPTSDDQIARIERRLADIQLLLEHQAIAIAQLQDEMHHTRRNNDWYHVQFSEMIRILTRDIREMRASLICSVINDGPINAQLLYTLLRKTADDERDLSALSTPPRLF